MKLTDEVLPLACKVIPMYSSWTDANWNEYDDPQQKIMNMPVNQPDNINLRNNTLVMMYL